MEDGTIGDAINPWGVALFRARLAEPQTSSAQSAYDKWLDQTWTARRPVAIASTERLASSPIRSTVLLLIAVPGFAYMLFFADRAELARSQAMLMASATTVVVATLLAIHALDNPYASGIGRIEPVAMERSLRILEEARSILGEEAPVPCDEDGVGRD